MSCLVKLISGIANGWIPLMNFTQYAPLLSVSEAVHMVDYKHIPSGHSMVVITFI